jgi:hypothetical protein
MPQSQHAVQPKGKGEIVDRKTVGRNGEGKKKQGVQKGSYGLLLKIVSSELVKAQLMVLPH